jgi:hypothetical protein
MADIFDRLLQLGQLRNSTQLTKPSHKQRQPARRQRPQTHVYARASNGDGYKLALMGFDFADEQQRRAARAELANYLVQRGVGELKAARHADQFTHAWQFAAYSKTFFQSHLRDFRGALDLTPGSTGLKLFDAHQEGRHGAAVKAINNVFSR